MDQRVRLLDEIIPRYQRIKDPVERDLYQKEICRLLGIDQQAFRRRLAGQRDTAQHSILNKQQASAPQKQAVRDPLQETLLGLMAKAYPEARQEMAAHGLARLFDQRHLPLAEAVLAVDSEVEPAVIWPDLLSRLDDGEQKRVAASLLIQDQHLADINWRTAFEQCLKKLEKARTAQLRQIAQRLATLPEGDEYQELINLARESSCVTGNRHYNS